MPVEPAFLVDGALALPATAVRGRTVADDDEDAVTLAAEAGLALLERTRARPQALVLATTTPPYDEGGSVQALAELLGVGPDVFALELTASLRDGLAALRVAAALGGTALVCASHRGRGRDDGHGGAAVLVAADGGVAALRPGPARAEELRDRYRLAGAPERSEADPSFVWDAGAPRLAREWGLEAPSVVGPAARIAARAERELGGPGDELAGETGVLGAAHALARILLGLERPQRVLAAASGLAEAIEVEPASGGGAAEVAARARAALAKERRTEPPPPLDWSALDPYTSAPRSWRERGQDLRLEAGRCAACGRIVFPHPQTCPGCGSRELSAERLPRAGTVLTQTRDHVYPLGRSTAMAVVELDGGARFYGQVVPSASVAIGTRVRLVPRRLHNGAGAAQYFWKIAPAEAS